MCHAQGGNKFCRVILISVYFNYRRHTQFIVALFWPLHVHMAPRHPFQWAAHRIHNRSPHYHHHNLILLLLLLSSSSWSSSSLLSRPFTISNGEYPVSFCQQPVHSSLWLTPWLRNRFRSTTTVHSSRYYLIAFHISTPTRHRINCDIIGNPIRLLPPLVPSRPQNSRSSPSAQHQ